MKKNVGFTVLLVAVSFVFTGVCGQILSGSFEHEGDPNTLWYPAGPWVASDHESDANAIDPEILQTYSHLDKDGNLVTIEPVDGQYFVMLICGGSSDPYRPGVPQIPDYGRLTQIIDVNAGQNIIGAYFFATVDWYPPFNDTATIKLIPADPCSGLTEILLAYIDVNSVVYYRGEYGAGGCMNGWARFVRTIDTNEAGSYILELLVQDTEDDDVPSFLAVDNLTITEGPVEPWCNYILAGDINNDCKVDFFDYAIMLENWLIDCSITPENPACVPR